MIAIFHPLSSILNRSPNASETKSEYRNPNKPRKILARVTVFIAFPFAEQETLLRKLRLHMPSFVPQANHRLGQATVFIGQHAQARCAQQQISAARRFEPEPASAEHAQKMAAGKNQNVPVDGTQATYHPVGPGANLIRRFSSGATVMEQLPTGTFRKDLGRATAFILAVVPLVQVTIDFRHGSEASQLAGPRRALPRTGEHLGESQSFQSLSEASGVALPAFRERQVGDPCVLARKTPGGFPVPSHVNDRKRFTHTAGPFGLSSTASLSKITCTLHDDLAIYLSEKKSNYKNFIFS